MVEVPPDMTMPAFSELIDLAAVRGTLGKITGTGFRERGRRFRGAIQESVASFLHTDEHASCRA